MAQIPYGPEELAGPPMDGKAYLDFLDGEKAREYPEPPPFYQRLYRGELTRDHLKLWAKDMYSYWDSLYYSTGAIFVKTNPPEVRSNMLRKLVEIEGKEIINDITGATTPAYEELWIRFGEGVGVSREEIVTWKNFTRTHFALTTLRLYSRWWEWTWLDGVASLYASDLHNQEYLAQAYEALGRRYEVPDNALEFFRAYLADVETHIPWERDALSYWACTRERQLTAARAFRERLDIENQVLAGLDQAVTSERVPFQVP